MEVSFFGDPDTCALRRSQLGSPRKEGVVCLVWGRFVVRVNSRGIISEVIKEVGEVHKLLFQGATEAGVRWGSEDGDEYPGMDSFNVGVRVNFPHEITGRGTPMRFDAGSRVYCLTYIDMTGPSRGEGVYNG